MTRLPVVSAVVVAVAVAGCSNSAVRVTADATPQPRFTGFSPVPTRAAPTFSVYEPHACPSAPAAVPAPSWPSTLPVDLPRPVDATIENSSFSAAGIAITEFIVPESLITSLQTVLTQVKAAGYTLGRGDAEVAEADVPFAGSALRGTIRLVGTQACQTVWTVATAAGSAGDDYLLPHHGGSATPVAPASALPFGTP